MLLGTRKGGVRPFRRGPTVYGKKICGAATVSSAEALKDFLVSSNGNALDDKHFSSNAGDAMCGRGETKYRENKSERSLCQISHDICTKGTISVSSVKRGQGDERA